MFLFHSNLHLSQPANTSSLSLGPASASSIHSISRPSRVTTLTYGVLTYSLTPSPNSLVRHSPSLHLPRNHRHNHRISITIPIPPAFSSLPGPSLRLPVLSSPLLNEWQLSHLTATLLDSLQVDNIISRLSTSCTSPHSFSRKRRHSPLRLFPWVEHPCTNTHNSLRHYFNLD